MRLTEAKNLFDQEAFARQVRVRIAELGISQADCATATGVSKATISRICKGKAPDVENYLRLHHWLSSRAALAAKEGGR